MPWKSERDVNRICLLCWEWERDADKISSVCGRWRSMEMTQGQAAGGDIRLIRRKQVPAVDGRHTRLTPLGTVAQMQIQMYLTSVCASYLTRLSVPPSACAAHVPRSTHMSLLLVLLLLLLLLLMTPAKSSISRDWCSIETAAKWSVASINLNARPPNYSHRDLARFRLAIAVPSNSWYAQSGYQSPLARHSSVSRELAASQKWP